jgi:hypothetical protein
MFSYFTYDVTYGFVWFVDCGCLECSCWDRSFLCGDPPSQSFVVCFIMSVVMLPRM